MNTIGANGQKTNVSPVPPVADGRAAAAPPPAAKIKVGGGGVAHIPPPMAATNVPTTVKPSTPLYEAYKACTFKALAVAHKAAIVTSLKALIFENSDEGALVKIDICLPQSTHPITSLLFENDEQRKAIMGSLDIIKQAAHKVSSSDLAKLAEHFDGMVKGGWDQRLIDCCVKADEEAACAAACVSIAALPGKHSELAGDWGHLTSGKEALSTLLNSEETTERLREHQRITTETEALRLEIQELQHSQLSTAVGMEDAATLKEVNEYNAAIQAQNTALATQKAAIVTLGKQIQEKKTASSLNPQKVALDARHVELEKQAQSLSALKSKLTDAISRLDVRITASNSEHLAVGTEFVEAALSKWALDQLGALGSTLKGKDDKAMVKALLNLQQNIQSTTRQRASEVLSPLYDKFNARPPGTDAAIAACLTDISTQLATFDRDYQVYSGLRDTYQKDVTQFNQANATALTEVNTLVAQQAAAIAKLESSLAAVSVENYSKKSGLTVKIKQLNQAIKTAGTENLEITADLNTKITLYNANIKKLKEMEDEQALLVANVSSSNVAISKYNQDVADFATEVSVAKKQVAHIKQYNDITEVLDRRNAITKEIMAHVPAVTAAFEAIPPSPPSEKGSGGASGSDPYRLMSYDTRERFTPIDFSGVKIPPQIPRIDCRSLSSSFEPIAVATGRGIEPIQATLSEITVVIPEPEEGFLDITVQAATTIEREFPSIGMLANPNQPAITVRVPFITKEMLETHGGFLKKSGANWDRTNNWDALIKAVIAVNADKSTTQVTCPVKNQTKQAPFLTTVTGQENGGVWAFTPGPNGELSPTYLWETPTTKGKAVANAAKTAESNQIIKALQDAIAKEPPPQKK